MLLRVCLAGCLRNAFSMAGHSKSASVFGGFGAAPVVVAASSAKSFGSNRDMTPSSASSL